nr:MAG TPA: holin [Caudoviricetes sp.]
MNDFIQALTPALVSVAVVILGYVANIAGVAIKQVADKYEIKAKLDANKTIVDMSVKYAQQVFKEAKGEEKYEQAKEKALEIMGQKGIHISDAELNMLIEASVANFKKGLSEPVDPIQFNIVAPETEQQETKAE